MIGPFLQRRHRVAQLKQDMRDGRFTNPLVARKMLARMRAPLLHVSRTLEPVIRTMVKQLRLFYEALPNDLREELLREAANREVSE